MKRYLIGGDWGADTHEIEAEGGEWVKYEDVAHVEQYAGRLHEIARALLAAHDECRMHDAAQLVIDLRAVLNEKEGMAELVDALPSRVGINPAAALETDGTARMPGNVQLAGSSPAPLTNDEHLTVQCRRCGNEIDGVTSYCPDGNLHCSGVSSNQPKEKT